MTHEDPLGENLFLHLHIFGWGIPLLTISIFWCAPDLLWIVGSIVACWAPIVLIHAFTIPVPPLEPPDRPIPPPVDLNDVTTATSPVIAQFPAPSVMNNGWVSSL